MAKLSFIERGRRELARRWNALERFSNQALPAIPEEIAAAIVRSVNSSTKSYRYVLPTQLLAKLIDQRLDCLALQEGGRMPGAFDARSFCSKVIAPFDAANHNVLGGSGDPYVSNPLRQPKFSQETRRARKNKAGFDDLLLVLTYAQENPAAAEDVFHHVLVAIRSRLRTVRIVYPVPNRASKQQVTAMIQRFLGPRTGGVRLQVVSVALFKTVGRTLGMFHDVTSGNINAADMQTGKAADLECLDQNGRVVIAVEVKDRELTLRSIQEKLPMSREKGIRELLFLIQGGVA